MQASAVPARDSRVPALDFLRLVAAMMVLCHHWIAQGSGAWEAPTPRIFAPVHPMAAYGWMGVQLFFLISGFVICMSSWGRTLGDFFASRVSRLYPAYWVGVLATSLVVSLWPVMFKPLEVRDFIVNLTMLQEPLHVESVETVYWTLFVELRFYVLFALFVVWKGVTYRRAVLFCVLWTAASLIAPDSGLPELRYLLTPEYSMYFVAGIAMYLMRRFGPNLLLWSIVAVSWIRAQLAIVGKVHEMSGYVSRTLEWSTATLIITGFFAVVLAVALGATDRVRWRGFTVLGSLTYPLYLLHERIGWTLIRKLHHPFDDMRWALFAMLVTGMLVLSWLVYRQVEKPLGAWLRARLTEAIASARRPERAAPALSGVEATVPLARVEPPEPKREVAG